jgi:transposase
MILNLTSVRVFVAREPVDLRASFYRLAAHVRGSLGADPRDGHLYLFFGKSRKLVKVLFWDRSGFCIFSKKLEQGRFVLPKIGQEVTRAEFDLAQLTLILEGIDLEGATRRGSFQPLQFSPPENRSKQN